MSDVIIYLTDNDEIAVIYPTNIIPVNHTAMKDVPEDRPYLIVDESKLPKDHTFQSAWKADFSTPDGYGLGNEQWFNKYEKEFQTQLYGVPNVEIPEFPMIKEEQE